MQIRVVGSHGEKEGKKGGGRLTKKRLIDSFFCLVETFKKLCLADVSFYPVGRSEIELMVLLVLPLPPVIFGFRLSQSDGSETERNARSMLCYLMHDANEK